MPDDQREPRVDGEPGTDGPEELARIERAERHNGFIALTPESVASLLRRGLLSPSQAEDALLAVVRGTATHISIDARGVHLHSLLDADGRPVVPGRPAGNPAAGAE